jgi:hypothetical protein
MNYIEEIENKINPEIKTMKGRLVPVKKFIDICSISNPSEKWKSLSIKVPEKVTDEFVNSLKEFVLTRRKEKHRISTIGIDLKQMKAFWK